MAVDVPRSFSVSVSASVTTVIRAKPDEPIRMPFGEQTLGDTRSRVRWAAYYYYY